MRYEHPRDYENKIVSLTQTNLNYDLHFHQCVEFNRVLSGDGIIVTLPHKQEVFHIGELSFIPSLIPHSIESIGTTVEENLIIPFPFIEKVYGTLGCSMNFLSMKDKQANQKLFHIIDDIKALIGTPYTELTQALVNVLFLTIMKDYSYLQNEPVSSDFNLITQIIEYVNANFKNDLKLTDIAKTFGYNKNYFSKLFNSFFRCNFRTYLNRLRIVYVERELKQTKNEKKTIEIIHDAGFVDASSYYRAKNKLEPPPET